MQHGCLGNMHLHSFYKNLENINFDITILRSIIGALQNGCINTNVYKNGTINHKG